MKILYITTDWNTPYRIATGEYGGVSYYRAYGPAKALKANGWHVDILGHELADLIDKDHPFESYAKVVQPYDLVVLKQSDTANVAKLIGACKEQNIPIAMDLDDLVTELDPDNPATEQGYKQGGAKQAFAVAALSMVDALFVSTQPLADEYEKYLRIKLQTSLPIYVLPNCCDGTLWAKRKRVDDEYTILGWQGSITHDHDIAIMLPAIKALMKKKENLVLSLTGGIRQETYDSMIVKQFGPKLLPRVVINRGTQSFKDFPAYLQSHQWDIGVVPLKDTKFTRGKSHIKWMENSLIGVPTIASDVYPYREEIQGTKVIQDGFTGILCGDKDWYDKLEALIEEPKVWKYISRDARNYVLDNWTYAKHIYKWEEAFESVMKAGSKSLR